MKKYSLCLVLVLILLEGCMPGQILGPKYTSTPTLTFDTKKYLYSNLHRNTNNYTDSHEYINTNNHTYSYTD